MWEQGQKTKKTHFWMNDADIEKFSVALHEALPSIEWISDRGDFSSPTLVPILARSSNAFVAQAFAMLPSKDSKLWGLQFLTHTPVQGGATGSAHLPMQNTETRVEAGRLAIRWNVNEGDEIARVQLSEQLKVIWHTLRQTTLPIKVSGVSSGPLTGWRVGPELLKIAMAERWYLHCVSGLSYYPADSE